MSCEDCAEAYKEGQREGAEKLATLEADNLDMTIQIERLTAERDSYRLGMVAQQERVKAAEAERDEWRRNLHDLTPIGSEFVSNPMRCHDWVRDEQSRHLGQAVEATAKRREVEAERDDLRRRLEAEETKIERLTWTDYNDGPRAVFCRHCGMARLSPWCHKPGCVAEGVK